LETKNDDVTADVAQRECNNIKYNVSTFSNSARLRYST